MLGRHGGGLKSHPEHGSPGKSVAFCQRQCDKAGPECVGFEFHKADKVDFAIALD